MKKSIILSVLILLMLVLVNCSRKNYVFNREMPVKSIYPQKVTKIMAERQKKYYINIEKAIKEEGGEIMISAIASVKNSKIDESFLNYAKNYIRFSKYETAHHRENLSMVNEKILKSIKEMGFNPVKAYWSPVASPGFAAFTTSLPLIDPNFSEGSLIEVSNAIEDNLTDLSYVLLNLSAETSEKFENKIQKQSVKYRTRNQVDSVFSNAKYFQRSFNANILQYFFHLKKTELDSVSFLNNNMTSLIAADEAQFFICSHEYAHVLLKHVNDTQQLRFSPANTSVNYKNSIDIGKVSIANEFSADSLGLLLSRKQSYGLIEAGVAIALIWLDITERVQAAKYNYNIYMTHPPARDRFEAISKQMRCLGMRDEIFISFFYSYELLWKDFESVLKKELASNSHTH